MTKINKNHFLKYVSNVLSDKRIPSISSQDINEFNIGKNYFYEVLNNDELITTQKWLNNYLQENIEINNSAVAFRKGHSYLNLFEPHRKNYNFLRLDIKSFFHSIHIDDIRGVFNTYFISEEDLKKENKVNAYIDDEMQQLLLEGFLNLVTYEVPEDSLNENFQGRRILPMGFITSPVISNIIFRKLDIQIQKICTSKNIIYTRYADDMLFSSGRDKGYIHSNSFINEIRIIISQMGFKINTRKTIKSKHTISLNGYTIQHSYFKNSLGVDNIMHKEFAIPKNEDEIFEVRLSNKKIKIIKKMIHMINKERKPSFLILKKLFNYKLNPDQFKYPTTNIKTIQQYYDDQLLNRLTGYRAYLLSIVQFDKKYHCTQENTISKYLDIVNILNKIIDDKSR